MQSHSRALPAVAASLRCPNCAGPLGDAGRALRCADGHSFDLAREGYVALLAPKGRPAPGDTPAMVAARERFLAAGHYTPLSEELASVAMESVGAAGDRAGLVLDVGAGTGHHLARILDEWDDGLGVALDASRSALRRAVRAHERIAGVLGDAWGELPLQAQTVDLVLVSFAPRGAGEIARVLSAQGTLVVLTPTPRHLSELVAALGMLEVQDDKQARLHAHLSPELQMAATREVEFAMTLDHDDVEALVAMGPSAHHLDANALRGRLPELLPDQATVTASVVIETFRRAEATT